MTRYYYSSRSTLHADRSVALACLACVHVGHHGFPSPIPGSSLVRGIPDVPPLNFDFNLSKLSSGCTDIFHVSGEAQVDGGDISRERVLDGRVADITANGPDDRLLHHAAAVGVFGEEKHGEAAKISSCRVSVVRSA